MFLKTIYWLKVLKFGKVFFFFFGSSLVALMFLRCILCKIYYTLFLRELLWVPWLMTPYIYGIYVKRDLPYYIHLNFAEKGKNFLLSYVQGICYSILKYFLWILFLLIFLWKALCTIWKIIQELQRIYNKKQDSFLSRPIFLARDNHVILCAYSQKYF